MKQLIKIPLCALTVLLCLAGCSEDTTESARDFALDISQLEETIGPDGGIRELHIASSGRWAVVSDATWIKVSPANGSGPADCIVQIDSSHLANESRSALVLVTSEDQTAPLDFHISQSGYEEFIEVLDQDIELPNYGQYGKRTLDVKVKTNVPFQVDIPTEKRWVFHKATDISSILNRGARPRVITLHFTWDNNTRPEEREIEVAMTPEEVESPVLPGKLHIRQEAAEKITPGVKGDSLSVIAINRSMNCSATFNPAEKMSNWPNVTLWEATDDQVEEHPDWLGRVRSVKFSSATTEEEIPFEIQYLDAAEQIIIYANANRHLKNLSTGPHICKLKDLKSLQIFSYGLTELDPDFKNLVNLVNLDLSNNNFNEIPAVLTPENFPNLKALNLLGNRRQELGNIKDTAIDPEKWGGLSKTTTMQLQNLLKWENLDYLQLSFNFLQGNIPNITKYTAGFPKYQAGDQYRFKWDAKKIDPETGKKGVWEMHDIPQQLVGQPKVLPNTVAFSINLNYLYGQLPDWLLYHPRLLQWAPEVLVFKQESKYTDKSGRKVGFTNVPENPDYYYEWYPEQIPEEFE